MDTSLVTYHLTDTIGTSGTITLTADTPAQDLIDWYGCPTTDDTGILDALRTLHASLGWFKYDIDLDTARFLGLDTNN